MIRNFKLFTTMFFTLFCMSGLTQADDQLHLTHKVIASQHDGSNQMVSFRLTIENMSHKDLNRVKLSTSSNELSNIDDEKMITIGYLPSMGQAVFEWTLNTPVDVSYFQSGMPLYFIIEAKHNNGENFEIPVYSSGSTAL